LDSGGALVLAFVLGRMAEEIDRQSLLMSGGRSRSCSRGPSPPCSSSRAERGGRCRLILPPVRRMLRTVPPERHA